MVRISLILVFVLIVRLGFGQEREIYPDFRSHNLTQFNSSLIDPTFSYNRNMPRSISVWSRWQWQAIDSDPTTLFINYTQKLTNQTAIGLGFLQNNTGVFLNRGANLNFSYAFLLGEELNLVLGTNIFAFTQELADEQLGMNPLSGVNMLSTENSFIAQFSPGARINANGFSVGMVVENAFEHNFTNSDVDSTPRVFTGFVSHDFPILLFDKESYLRPQAYVRSIPDFDTQYGLTALLTNPKFWVQGGYNNFYGISGGAGITLFEKFSLGGLVEFGSEEPASNEDPTFEILASYFFGKQNFEIQRPEKEGDMPQEELYVDKKPQNNLKKEIEEDRKTDIEKPKIKSKKASKRQLRIKEKRRQDSIQRVLEEKLAAEKEKRRLDSIASIEQERIMEQVRQDSVAKAKSIEIALLKEKARKDSIMQQELKKEVELLPNERYEEVTKEEGLQPGFYLIANVFGTKKYYENFMKTLKGQGLSPGSFYRSLNKYNYVYLKRYNSINEARKARDSKFEGKYKDKLWILRIR